MKSEISLFSKKSFIELSKKFVCVRLGTLENKKHQDMVRAVLRGTFQNSAFVVFAPDGKTKLSRSGRVPSSVFRGNVEPSLEAIAKKYKAQGKANAAVLQDFHSFKQSLNVASCDQRLLVFTVATNETKKSISEKQLRIAFNDPKIIGRFHFDQAGGPDKDWDKHIKNKKLKEGSYIISPGTFGQSGTILAQLPLNSSAEKIKKTLLDANEKFKQTEKRKVYSEHVKEGKRKGINFINGMPPGEDRDGDGKIDKRGPKGPRGHGPPPHGPRF